jgi:uncharacterized membrane protein YagU involved in acid resistance
MNLFAHAFSDQRGHGVQEPQALGGRGAPDAAELAGTSGVEALTEGRMSPAAREWFGTAAHYGFSAALGVLYAVTTRSGRAGPWRGAAFGTGVWLIADEGLVPLLGLSRRPEQIPPPVHLYAWAGHCVFGMTVHASLRALAR